MNWNFLITFACGIGAYLLFLLVFILIKRHKIKKANKQDDLDNGVNTDEDKKQD